MSETQILILVSLKVKVLVSQQYLTLCDPQTAAHQAPLSMEFSGKNTGVGCHALSRGSSQLRDRTWVSCIAVRFFTIWATRKALSKVGRKLLKPTSVNSHLTEKSASRTQAYHRAGADKAWKSPEGESKRSSVHGSCFALGICSGNPQEEASWHPAQKFPIGCVSPGDTLSLFWFQTP